jgi:YVTN family beta-propeller protein
MGLAWHPDGTKLYVSGGNNKNPKGIRAPIYVFGFAHGRLTQTPTAELHEEIHPARIYWAGLAHHPTKPLLFAANRTEGQVVVFDTDTKRLLARIPTEVNPYDLVLSAGGRTLYCSNWASDSVSVIDTAALKVSATIGVGDNPNDMVLARDGRLFVACSNDNSVVVINTKLGRPLETIVTSMHPRAPEGSTPNALALDSEEKTLFVANADNNNVAVVDISKVGKSVVLGFLPTGWYPSALAVSGDGQKLYVGTAKGIASSGNIRGPNSPLPPGKEGAGSTKSLMKGAVHIVDLAAARRDLRKLTAQVYANSPYKEELMAEARPAPGASVVPRKVGTGSPIKHVIYFIKENRTYDQVLGDMPQGNGDARLAIFGREVTPNHHKIAEEFVLLDNLYCDAEVSADGHQWSNAAYATDFSEKNWPASYGGMSNTPATAALYPASGYLWDRAARRGLTYRSYGEMARRVSEGEAVKALTRGLEGHVAPGYLGWGARDTENAAEFIREFDEYEKNYDSKDPNRRLPNFIVVCLPENHTRGTRPGAPTPRAAVASNDYALGLIVDRVSHSRYWPEIAIFAIEDDAQDGPDHVDARRTVGLVISAYCHHRIVDSTLYTTSAMLRTIELLLGMQPMSQYDAAAVPMYASFSDKPDLTPYEHVNPHINLQETNKPTAYGAQASLEMDFSDFDLAPMFALNDILWGNAKGADSPMPLPISRFHWAGLAGELRARR